MAMGRITMKIRNSLVQLFRRLHQDHPEGVLMFGYCKNTEQTFCKVINLQKASSRLLSCTRLIIAHVSHFSAAEAAFCAYLRMHIRAQPNPWWHLVSPSKWMAYNIDSELFCINLGVASTDYYIILRRDMIQEFRKIAFAHE